jgi:hypothetical protein
VTVFDTNLAAILNVNCSCGGSWVVGVPRVLTSCPINCNSTFFVAGDLGVPGFGNWRRYPSELRFVHISLLFVTFFVLFFFIFLYFAFFIIINIIIVAFYF